MKAAIYCRVSTEGQEQDGTSLQTQLEACLNYCQLKGYEVACQLTEAWSGLSLERPKLAELREVVRSPTHHWTNIGMFDFLHVRLAFR